MAPKKPGGAATRTATGGVLNNAIRKAREAKYQMFVFRQMDEVLDQVLNAAILHEKYRAHVAAIAAHVRAPHRSSDALMPAQRAPSSRR